MKMSKTLGQKRYNFNSKALSVQCSRYDVFLFFCVLYSNQKQLIYVHLFFEPVFIHFGSIIIICFFSFPLSIHLFFVFVCEFAFVQEDHFISSPMEVNWNENVHRRSGSCFILRKIFDTIEFNWIRHLSGQTYAWRMNI